MQLYIFTGDSVQNTNLKGQQNDPSTKAVKKRKEDLVEIDNEA